MAQSPENKEKEQRGQVAGTEGGEGLFRCPTPQRTACGLRKPGCLHLKLCVGTAVRTRMGAGGVIFKDSPDIHFTGRETSHHEAEPVLEHSGRSFWHEKLLFLSRVRCDDDHLQQPDPRPRPALRRLRQEERKC